MLSLSSRRYGIVEIASTSAIWNKMLVCIQASKIRITQISRPPITCVNLCLDLFQQTNSFMQTNSIFLTHQRVLHLNPLQSYQVSLTKHLKINVLSPICKGPILGLSHAYKLRKHILFNTVYTSLLNHSQASTLIERIAHYAINSPDTPHQSTYHSQ